MRKKLTAASKCLRQSVQTVCLLSLFLSQTVLANDTGESVAFVGAGFTAGYIFDTDKNSRLILAFAPITEQFDQLRNGTVSLSNYSPEAKSGNPFYFFDGLIKISENPVERIKEQVSEAARGNPKLIIGIDMLFWPVYAKVQNAGDEEKIRLERLREVLRAMEESNQNYVISSLPVTTMDAPKLAGNKSLKQEKYKVSESTIDKANEILKDWVNKQNEKTAETGKVLLLDIGGFFRDSETSEFYCGSELGNQQLKRLKSAGVIYPNKFGVLCFAGHVLSKMYKSPLSQFHSVAWEFDQTKIHSSPHSEL
ncbi:hypothetical protein [Endozoicomonas euniceicola]|uniref:Uncharacterized protein n=1 Tax=Endozoicomonas euniceicola TaxID=1234143 RepID=A0ABY6H0T0_9GAMM|nr:hypothetical protein [Endozoicomonas euniceicola]UYM18407.1 hypothetical protein NX720_11010 [Endozoicomonas euniceicola]